jgi:hypothetical protein
MLFLLWLIVRLLTRLLVGLLAGVGSRASLGRPSAR